MRRLCFLIGLAAAAPASAQKVVEEDEPSRFDIPYNIDLYSQKTPKETLKSVLGALEREALRLPARLPDRPGLRGQAAGPDLRLLRAEGAGLYAKLPPPKTDAARDARRADVERAAKKMNFDQAAAAIRKKFFEDPEALKDLKRFLAEGDFNESGDAAEATLKDVKDRKMAFRKVGRLWVMKNDREEPKRPAKE